MGGRGASSGISSDGKQYGSEYRTVLKSGNIKFVIKNVGSANAPMETRTRGRVYVTVNDENKLKFISYYDRSNKRSKQIDIDPDKPLSGVSPHTHHGYLHAENDSSKGYSHLTADEKEMVARVKNIWYNRKSK